MEATLANQEESQNKHLLYPLHASDVIALIGIFLFCIYHLWKHRLSAVTNSEAYYKFNRQSWIQWLLLFYINRLFSIRKTVVLLKMTYSTSGRRCLHKLAEYIVLYFAVAIWKKAVPCLLFSTLKPASKALSSFCHSERKLWWKPTHFPRAHPHSLTVPSHMKGDCHS